MVPDANHAFLGLEYFCFENDEMWSKPDADLIRLATAELDKIGLWKKSDVTDGVVIRQKKAYPVYDEGYKEHVTAVRQELDARYPGFWTVGRNGMHKYNNQDHSMMTALVAARNILGEPAQDPWRVNIDAAYIEEKESPSGASGERQVPHRI
jgi:protoporphyrinogen oxidase